jgi:branched-chain amino acid transport system permease protein
MILRLSPLLIAAILIALAPIVLKDGQLALGTEMFVVLVIASMWNLLAGYAGLVSLGHQAFFGIGGYAVFWISNTLNLHPLAALPFGAVAAGIAALVIAPLLFRLRDAYFAIGSWVLAEIAFILVQRSETFGGITGMPLFTGAMLGRGIYAVVFWTSGAAAVLTILALFLALRAPFGLGLMSVRDNELAAAAVGVNVWRGRLFAFVASAAGVGFVAGLYLIPNYFIQPGVAFDPSWTVVMTFVVVIGGIGTLEGPIVGTILYFLIRQLVTNGLGFKGSWYLVALGLAAILTMLVASKGLWPAFRDRFGFHWLDMGRRFPGPHR